MVEKGLLEGTWNVAEPVSQSEDNDGLFVTEGLVYRTVFPHEHERMGSGEDHVTS